MRRTMFRILLATLLVSILSTALAVPAFAADLRSGDTITIGKDEVVNDDVYLVAQTIIIDGTVNGDVFAVAQDITIAGTINGGVTLAGNFVTISGTIANGARVAGQTVNITGKINRDLVVAGSILNLSGGVKRDLLFGFQTANVGGTIDGNIKGGSTDATVSAKVGGNVDLAVSNLTLGPTTAIQGTLTYRSSNKAEVQSGAQVRGTTTQLPPPSTGSDVPGRILGFFMITVTGIIVLLVFGPKPTKLADAIRAHPWYSLGWGAIILVAVPLAAIIVMITIIGLPLGLIGVAAYVAALYLSQIPVGLLVGRLIIRGDGATEARSRTVLVLVIGLAVLFILGLIPFINVIASLGTVLLGLGSLLVWLNYRKKKPSAQLPLMPTA